ncbi:glycerophosphoryl diester phosphodiesterase [Francisella tularensis subsp. holarctica]|nr:glycerophosphoryl diester phosphodiesterase [Francisella tularensis subsp. holarctica]
MHVDKFISHRGANSDFIENTIEAFQIAKAAGFNWFETDVQMSSDGELFLFHDKTPKRFADCDKNVIEMTLAELKQIQLADSVLKVKAKIPTLREYLDWASENDVFTNLELKISTQDKKYQQKLVENVFKILQKYPNLKTKVLISSFSNFVMKLLKKYKDYPQGKLFYTVNWPRDFSYIDKNLYKNYKQNRYLAIIINYCCLNQQRVNYLKRKFDKIFVYSVYTDCEAKQLLAWDIDAMFIDKKEQLNLTL